MCCCYLESPTREQLLHTSRDRCSFWFQCFLCKTQPRENHINNNNTMTSSSPSSTTPNSRNPPSPQHKPSLQVGEGSFQMRRPTDANYATNHASSSSRHNRGHRAPPPETPLRSSLKQLLTSKFYFYYSIGIVILTLLLFLWLLIARFQPSSWLFISLDFLVCVSFTADVLIRIYIQTPSLYFDCFYPNQISQKLMILWNWFDCAVVWLSVLSFCLYIVSTQDSTEESIDATMDVLLICFRAAATLLRLWVVIKSSGMNYRRVASNHQYIDLFDDDSTDGDFTMAEVIEREGAEEMPMDHHSDSSDGLDEDDLFSRPSMDQKSSPKKQQNRASSSAGTFASMTSRIGNAFGLNDSDEEDTDSDDSGLGEDDLFARPSMSSSVSAIQDTDAAAADKTGSGAPMQTQQQDMAASMPAMVPNSNTASGSHQMMQSQMSMDSSAEDAMFQSCIQDPTLEAAAAEATSDASDGATSPNNKEKKSPKRIVKDKRD